MKQYICQYAKAEVAACAGCEHGKPHAPLNMYEMRHGIEFEHRCSERGGWCSVVRDFTLCEPVMEKSEISTL